MNHSDPFPHFVFPSSLLLLPLSLSYWFCFCCRCCFCLCFAVFLILLSIKNFTPPHGCTAIIMSGTDDNCGKNQTKITSELTLLNYKWDLYGIKKTKSLVVTNRSEQEDVLRSKLTFAGRRLRYISCGQGYFLHYVFWRLDRNEGLPLHHNSTL